MGTTSLYEKRRIPSYFVFMETLNMPTVQILCICRAVSECTYIYDTQGHYFWVSDFVSTSFQPWFDDAGQLETTTWISGQASLNKSQWFHYSAGARMWESLDQCYPHRIGSVVLGSLRHSQRSCHAALITVMNSQCTSLTWGPNNPLTLAVPRSLRPSPYKRHMRIHSKKTCH